MDFGTLLHVAKKNSENVKTGQGKYYSTKFSAPKKEAKEKTLSDNIKKFLEKKEQEERLKARQEKEKKEKLLAMRDEKSKNKIKKMLKVIKSANKSVLEDAVDSVNTAVTLHGPDQPDEDDYGYVSHEAAALYKKYMDKVKALPDDKKFTPSRPQSKNDLSGTKDRVRAAIQREQLEKMNPTRSKSSKTSLETSSSPILASTVASSTPHRRKDLYDPQIEKELEEKKRKEEEQKKTKLKKPAPAPLDFKDLLKLAEKKQHEPVEVFVEPKKEPERLLTKKEKREMEERQRYLEERERRKKEGTQNVGKVTQNDKIPKIELKSSSLATKKIPVEKNINNSSSQKLPINGAKEVLKKPPIADPMPQQKISSSKSKLNNSDQKSNTPINSLKIKPQESGSSSSNATHSKSSTISNSNGLKTSSAIKSSAPKSMPTAKSTSALPSKSYDGPPRQFPPRDTQINQKNGIPNRKDIKGRKLPISDIQKTRQFPPPDMRNPKLLKKPMKRRILDDDEDEYDSELDDFIDDGPEDDQSYSNYIKEIFGYDKSRYRDVEDDDGGMESTFAQQMKEEYLSKKIGLMEDLEDMRLEAEEKKRKVLMKKRKLK